MIDPPTAATNPPAAPTNESNINSDRETLDEEKNVSIEYRKSLPYSRPNSEPENIHDLNSKRSNITHRTSEQQPFTHTTLNGENGKFRRSFAVRSREGLENIFASIRKGPESGKTKQMSK